MRVGTYVYGNGHDIRNAPVALLCGARDYVILRLNHTLASIVSTPELLNSRRRCTIKWLTRWLVLISQEILRQEEEFN
jgi:hypothetical protein